MGLTERYELIPVHPSFETSLQQFVSIGILSVPRAPICERSFRFIIVADALQRLASSDR